MKLTEIRDLINSVDPNAKHYDASKEADVSADFTVWMETERIIEYADDEGNGMGWRVTIERYTHDEYDAVADALEAMLLADPRMACKPRRVTYYIGDHYIRHTFEAEAV